ncbi:hypothetical protein niasHT_006402 [Heterodera trifolii]|uniref:DNA polymerase delta subunit 3 n=1 Tax=Heterodera trifolii TaxID=157864 RepID=A0ABD2M673_9BILA
MVEEHQSKNFLELLNRLVLVEQKIVTVAFLLRSTPLNVFQTQSLLTRFLEFNSNVTANYYLLGPLKAELGKKHCAIVKGDQLADAKRRLAKVDICNVFSVQTKRTDCESLGDVFRTDWYDQKVPSLSKGFLKNSKAPSEFRSLSPIRSPPNHKKEEGKEVNEEDDREAEENATEVKKATGAKTLIRRPISFTPICKEEEQRKKQQKEERDRPIGKECIERDDENAMAHPPLKRPTAQTIKREAKVAKTKVTENGGSKQTTLLSFFKK